MSKDKKSMPHAIRIRFAPSPVSFMHLENIRTALMNYLFAHHYDGIFVLRIEDTEANKGIDHTYLQVLNDLEWLGITYDEGPLKKGFFGPYLQSERMQIYQEKLHALIETRRAYRCFCSLETLEKKRQQQVAAGKPPRYDRTCLNYSDDKIKQKINANLPFVWRFHLNEHQVFEIYDKAKGIITFDMKNFSDFALTREDGSYTFLFANFIDDWLMEISHVIRGEEYTNSTALQANLFDAFDVRMPVYWHLPTICNATGERLSRQDFGFSLADLKQAGFLPHAINNYLGIIGSSFKQEILSLQELARAFNFDHLHAISSIKYDLEKLAWVNHQWMLKLSLIELVKACKPFIYEAFPAAQALSNDKLYELVQLIQPELKTLQDVKQLLHFYFEDFVFDKATFVQVLGSAKAPIILKILNDSLDHLTHIDEFLEKIKMDATHMNISTKEIFSSLRYLLCGTFNGISIKELLTVLDPIVAKKRLQQVLE